jgi:acid phosphatase
LTSKPIVLIVLFITLVINGACVAATPVATIASPRVTPAALATNISSGATPIATSASPFGHIYLIVMENSSYTDIVGNSNAPYLNSLIANYGLATNYRGVARPSEPNYLALFSGSTQGVADNNNHNLDGQTIADQLEAHGKTWKVFAQNVPLDCATGETASGGEDGAGDYARKHEPAISFTAISAVPARCLNITDFTHFDPAAADFEFITPNLCNNMHDCSTATGDAFLRKFVPTILDSPAWQQGGLLFITWDESEGTASNQVATLVISKAAAKGFQSAIAHDHYSLLRTIEDVWGLGCLNKTCTANNFNEFFH